MQIKISAIQNNTQNFCAINGKYLRVNKQMLRKYIEEGLTCNEIAKIHDTKPEYIKRLIKLCDLTTQGLLKLQKNEKDIIELKNNGKSNNEIVEITGLTKNTVRNILKHISYKSKQENICEITNKMNKNNTSIQTIKNPLNYCELKAKNFYANITERKGLKNREEMCKKIIELIDKGYNISEIGIELNRSEYCIRGYIKYCKQKNLLIS